MRSFRLSARFVSTICFLTVVTVFALVPTVVRAQDQSAATAPPDAEPPQEPASQLVTTMIWRIGYQPSPEVRRENAASLGWLFGYLRQEGKLQSAVSNSNIDTLVGLLKDDIEAEDAQVALALAAMGPRAGAAVPALKAAHDRACSELPIVRSGIWPVDDFEFALKMITGQEPRCQ